MDLKKWFEELQSQLDALSQAGLEMYHPESNKILPPKNPELLDTISTEFNVVLSPSFREFYNMCGAMYLQIQKGYYIIELEMILRPEWSWLQLTEPDNGKVVVFGNDDTGESFAIRSDEGEKGGEVLFLLEGGKENHIYRPMPLEEPGYIPIAADFYGFLERLLEDIKAFGRGDKEWQYIGRPPSTDAFWKTK